MEARAAFPHGAYPIRVEEAVFSYADYAAGLARNADTIATFKAGQQAAFEAERNRWARDGLDTFIIEEATGGLDEGDIPAGCLGVSSAVPGNIWKYTVELGAEVAAGATIAIIESMKMEIAVTTLVAGRLREIRAVAGRTIRGGDIIAIIEEN